MCEVGICRMVLWCDHVVNHDCQKKKKKSAYSTRLYLELG